MSRNKQSFRYNIYYFYSFVMKFKSVYYIINENACFNQ